MTNQEYANLCYRLKGEIVEWTTLIQYQLSFVICFNELPHEPHNSIKFGKKVYEICHDQNFNNQINMGYAILKNNPLIPNDIPLDSILHNIREYRNDVTHKLIEISSINFHWSDNNQEPGKIYRVYSLEPYIEGKPYIPFSVRANTIEQMEININNIKDIAYLLREILKSTYNYHI